MTRNFLIHYGELALKGRNRPDFEARLVSNIRAHLQDLEGVRVRKLRGLLIVEPGEADPAEIGLRLRHVSGIAYFHHALVVEKDLDAVARTAAEAFKDISGTFRVTAKRSDKGFPQTSDIIARTAGAAILKANPELSVDLHAPDHVCSVEVGQEAAYVSKEKVRGAGGLPVGTSGKLLSMISGGIDSPVASAMMLQRGAPLHFLHFHNFPYTDRASMDIVRDLITRLNANALESTVSFINLTPVQEEIAAACPEKLRIILYRRMMFRIGERIAAREGAGGFVTGEALGQVASQTVENLRAIEAVTPLPILRPLIGMEKEEIIRRAEQLGTYATSIRPHSDCCALFVPKHPATKARLDELEAAETKLDTVKLINTAIEKEERVNIDEVKY